MSTPAATADRMVNGRVPKRAASRAEKILKRNGLSMSAFIRNSLEYVARTGSVPESGFAEAGEIGDADAVRSLIAEIDALALPGRGDFAGMGDDEMAERIRMERYGY